VAAPTSSPPHREQRKETSGCATVLLCALTAIGQAAHFGHFTSR